MNTKIIDGNILDQDVEVIVNPWNRNIIPWWLLLPQGVSGAIKKRGGYRPFIEIGKNGPIPLGGAVMTTAGKLSYKAIIHVAGINMLWFSSEKTIRKCVRSAIDIVNKEMFASVAFPVIGSGTGRMNKKKALKIMVDELSNLNSNAEVIIVQYHSSKRNSNGYHR